MLGATVVHVYFASGRWNVRCEGRKARKRSDVFPTMKEAIGRARALARASVPSKMLVYSKDGLMRDYVTYGLRRIPQWPKGPNSERIEKAVVRLTIERLTSKDELARV